MMAFTNLASVLPILRWRSLISCGWRWLPTWPGSRAREHTESDLRCYLAWCAERNLDPLTARRLHLELYIRWMQEIRHFKPSTVSRRFSVAAGFYKNLRHRRPAGAFTRRARPAALGTPGITDARIHPPAVRGHAHRRPPVTGPVRLRAGGHARPARPADLRSHRGGHHPPRRRTQPPGPARARNPATPAIAPSTVPGRGAGSPGASSASSSPFRRSPTRLFSCPAKPAES
jgi:hypothetical protein